MNPKIFRLHNQGKKATDWFESVEQGEAVIQQITDPSGDTAKRQITSIPSPFARIDLIKTAFQYVVRTQQLEGNTIYHRMVSECLDIGEIFFNIDELKDKVSIISWNSEHDLNKLIQSNNSKHQLLGKTLALYLKQDAKAYNFDQLKKIFLLKYKANGKILGGTSPVTLFFSAADDLDFVDIRFDNDKLFDGQYNPLYGRSEEYQKFLNHYVREYNLQEPMRFFFDYLELSNKRSEFYNSIESINGNFLGAYTQLDVGVEGDSVEILGAVLGKKKENKFESDFIIATEKYSQEPSPLVLQNHYGEALMYTNRVWDRETLVPYYNSAPLFERVLPACNIKHPYLTVSDFLEPQLIRLIYPVNKTYYQQSQSDADKGYLLPLKPAFFDFFSTDDLLNKRLNDKPMLEMQRNNKEVKVSLRIPIKKRGKYMTFERTYSEECVEADENSNAGKIVEKAFSVALFPCLKVDNVDNHHYRIMLTDTTLNGPDYQLSFYRNTENTRVNPTHDAVRSKKLENGTVSTRFFVLEHNFDYIQIEHAGAMGLIIPKFKIVNQGTEEFTFAVDFGTTNTHVEYKTGNRESQPFEYTEKDYLLATLHDPAYQAGTPTFVPIAEQLLHEFIPYKLDSADEFKFPQRTLVEQSTTWKPPSLPYVLAEFNIPFTYEKLFIPKDSKLVTGLKWSDYKDEESKIRVKMFLEVIMLLIRNKVLLSGGNLAKTKLMWFYPSSMNSYKVTMLETLWTIELCQKYLDPNVKPRRLLEAVAPFYYYKKNQGVLADYKSVASIDIGGGTTDIVIFEGDHPILNTSFRFAGNAVFGDGYSGSLNTNGFYKKYGAKIQANLQGNHDLLEAIREIERSGNSEDVITAFFSLDSNKRLKDKKIDLKFSEQLRDDNQLKIVFLVFYGAIIYHLAHFMKANGLDSPYYITFSGTASKILNLADPSAKLEHLAKLTHLIFAGVYGVKDNLEAIDEIILKRCEQPKEITCKGGVLAMAVEPKESKKAVFLGSTTLQDQYPESLTYRDISKPEIQNAIEAEIKNFIELFFGLHQQMNFNDHFGIEPALLEKSKKILGTQLLLFLKAGCNRKLNEIKGSEDEKVEETLFFYPLVGALHKLASEL